MHRTLSIAAMIIACLVVPRISTAQVRQSPAMAAPLGVLIACDDRPAPHAVVMARPCVRMPAVPGRWQPIPADSSRLISGASAPAPVRRSAARRILGAVVGATGGFFAGAYTGAWIEGDRCHCDDPGLKGALIGAPVGAVVGGILGEHYLF